MLDFPIVDTHLHVWDPGWLRYAWLDDIPKLNRAYLLEDYDDACGPVPVDKMVFLQCECDFSQFAQEADWVGSLARSDPRIEGIVPWAPLEQGAAARAELELLAANPLVKGIRRIIQSEPGIEFCLSDDFVRGVRLLEEFGLHFEICISNDQMAGAIRLARQCPEVRFVLDHVGNPDIRNQVLEPWASELRELAALSNVWCKVSGMVSQADHERWTREDLKPYVDHVVDCFGFDRLMYGGDWPVATLATDYPRWVETLRWAVAGCSDDELRKLFRENAVYFYRLVNDRPA